MNSKKLWTLLLLALFFVSILSLSNIPPVQANGITMKRTFYTSTSDGRCMNSSGTYGVTRNATTGSVTDSSFFMNVGQVNTTIYIIYRAFLYFDTSVIPSSANIVNATLSIRIAANSSDTDFNITIQAGMPIYPHDALESGDYYHEHYSGNGGSRSTSEIGALDFWNITLTSQGVGWIQKGGSTKFCLRSSREISNTPPSGAEYVNIYAREYGEQKAARLYVCYTTELYYLATLYGAYYEDGSDAGAINVTFYRPEQPYVEFELNGTYQVDAEADTRLVFHFDIGYNESRVYYWRYGLDYEDIYVFKPSEPYYPYYFTIVDFVGITNGYLESVINVGGQERVVERWRLDILNDIPFTLSWGHAYKFRLICDEGTYVFGTYVAGATTSFTLVVSHDLFPEDAIHTANISLSAKRVTSSHIQVNFTDEAEKTNWVEVVIYKLTASSAIYTTNNTGNSQQINWYDAENDTDYRGVVTVNHETLGSLRWGFSFPAPFAPSNPWDFSFLGEFPIDSKQIIGLFLVLLVFGCFSYESSSLAMIIGVIVAMMVTAIGWLHISWAWLSCTLAIAVIAAFSIERKRSEKGGIT